MTNKIIFLVSIFSYSIIVSQPFMYMLAMKQMQMGLNGSSYTEVRQLIDAAMRNNFKYVLYTAVFANLALILANIKNPGGLAFITASISLLALVAEIVITLKGSLPVNDVINTWSAQHQPANWQEFRDKWFHVFQFRQIITISGFVSLLIGAVFGKS